jgi:RHS repeat-associated protein
MRDASLADQRLSGRSISPGAGFAPPGPAPPPPPERPSLTLPKGGGALRAIGEKFAAHPATGTGSLTVPLPASPGRAGFEPGLGLFYDSGAGNGCFGIGWQLMVPAITRRTDRGLPRYLDGEMSDVFILSGAEDLVPSLDADGNAVVDDGSIPGFRVERFRPRVESSFLRIERWTRRADGDVHWRTLSPDNVLAIYGKDGESRIADPSDGRRVFSWLLSEVRDDRGNAVVYRYKAEDAVGVDWTRAHEVARGPADSNVRSANRYPKRVLYGNRAPFLDEQGRRPVDVTPEALAGADWMFELVFDYGEHDPEAPAPRDDAAWACRADPFSTYRAGFEVRTYRLCQRILMFHHFPDEAGVGADCLVRSLDVAYRGDPSRGEPLGSFVETLTGSGYIRADGGGYERASFPPLTLTYSNAEVSGEVERLDLDSAANLPMGLGRPAYDWVDLDGEGLSGVLTEQGDAWWYKRNEGDGRLGSARLVGPLPSLADLTRTRQQLLDVTGDGQIELVQLDTEPAGYYSRADDDWASFVPFESLPSLDWSSAQLQLLDVTGDGLADLLLTEDEAFVWYPSLRGSGFGASQHVAKALDEDRGPRLVLADGTETIFLADMSGDGLTDLVRIRSNDICYWPNLGYGRFGAKVTMDEAPLLDPPDRFDPRRIRLADVDGSGVVDLLYIGDGEVGLWLNESGNGWSAPQPMPDLPHVDGAVDVQVADLLGNGAACLVWSSPLPEDVGDALRYVDLVGGTKPHLLVEADNGMGARTRVRYAPSTKFYLADRRAGRPWVTRLPFPVHVVEQVEDLDEISRTRFVSAFRYHHGYYDGQEREFRGFAMVEQDDAQAFEDYVAGVKEIDGTQELGPELFQPPVTTRTWFHTGAYLEGERILHQLRREYFDVTQDLPEPALPADLTTEELRECVRALKGLRLRQEVYSFDASPEAQYPYTTTEATYEVRRLQRRQGQQHGVFFPHATETLTHHYERGPADPRIAHTLNLVTGPYGELVESAAVVYGRLVVDPQLPQAVTDDQQRRYVTNGSFTYTADIDELVPVPAYRLRVPYETRTYEVTGVSPASSRFELVELRDAIAVAAPIDYEATADGTAQKRLLSRTVTLFRDDALAPAPLGTRGTLGLTYQSYALAFTPAIVAAHYGGTVGDADLAAAGYVHLNDANWWVPSGIALYLPDAAAHFYLAHGVRDALGLETRTALDAYDLLTERVAVTQAPWNVVQATNDYRVLGPVLLTDPNGNRSAVEIDALGLVTKSALLGKEGANEGDTLADPTEQVSYDLFNWRNKGSPNYAHILAREQHAAANTRWRETYVYSNGSGGVAMAKTRVRPGKALQANPDGTTSEVDADPRWVGSGRTILNNKGKPVKKYEPFFSPTSAYDTDEALRTVGSKPILYYDPLGRNVRTDFANGTFTRTEFTPWLQRALDPNDTARDSRWYVERGSPDPVADPEPADPEQRAAWLTARHAGTATIGHLDSLGRPILGIVDYGNGTTAAQRIEADLTGRVARIFDQLGREVASGFVGLVGTPMTSTTAERGTQHLFPNVLGQPARAWDEQGRAFRFAYDPLHRLVSAYARHGAGEVVLQHLVYGDRRADAAQLNLLGATHLLFDQAGLARIPELDFKGNPKSADRIFARDYTAVVDWSDVAAQEAYADIEPRAAPLLDMAETFTTSALYDALNRPRQVALADGTVLQPTYDDGGYLEKLQGKIGGAGAVVEFLKNQDHDAKGQRQLAHYGNDLVTRYFYDPSNFRLTSLVTSPLGADPATTSLQSATYTYDPVGNVVEVADAAQQTYFFANAVVKSGARYEYDALYELVHASGRELAGANDAPRGSDDLPTVGLPQANDATAVRAYSEDYGYDLLGNLTTLQHRFKTQAGVGSGWTRHYRYAYQDDPADRTNRLSATSLPGDPDGGPYTATYVHDAWGNMTQMPQLAALDWNVLDQLRRADLGGGGTAYYVYGAGGERVRKVIDRNGTLQLDWLFLGPIVVFRRRRRDTGELRYERWTVHVADSGGPFAQADTKTIDVGGTDPGLPLNAPVLRYQLTDHLQSVAIETDTTGAVIGYEEYQPYGTTAYRSSKPANDVSLKRFRFSGHEHDDELGLYYFGARYYAPWLGRWTSADPSGFADGTNLFVFAHNSPTTVRDAAGLQGTPTTQTFDIRITESRFTGGERPTVEDFRGYLQQHGTRLDPRINAQNSRIFYLPQYHYDVESHTFEAVPGGTWVLQSIIRGAPHHRHAAPRHPPPAPPPPPAAPPPEAAAPPPAPTAPPPPATGTPGTEGGALSVTAPAGEKFIWNYRFPGEGLPGTQRGRILENLYGVPWRSNTKNYDLESASEVKQIKSTSSYGRVAQTTRSATRDAAAAIADNPTGTMTGKRPQAVIITPTDAPAGAGSDVATALNRGRPIPNAAPPEHVRGLPGRVGVGGRILTGAGFALSAYALWGDYERGDVPMGVGDGLGLVGGGLEIYAIAAPGATIAGASAMTVGLALGGIGIAVASAVSMKRAIDQGDTAGAIAGGVGVGAGLAIAAGAVGIALGVAAAPVVLAVGVVAAIGVGIFHLGRHFSWW